MFMVLLLRTLPESRSIELEIFFFINDLSAEFLKKFERTTEKRTEW